MRGVNQIYHRESGFKELKIFTLEFILLEANNQAWTIRWARPPVRLLFSAILKICGAKSPWTGMISFKSGEF